jgi:hypothetical protein
MPYYVTHGFGNFFDKIGQAISRALARWRRATSPNRYRPEKHYMRGPGPKARGEAGSNGRDAQT